METNSIEVSGVKIDLRTQGVGRSLLYLHGGMGPDRDGAFLDALAAEYHVIAPTHPGFGGSDWPQEFRTVDDLAYFYLDFADQHEIQDGVLVGACFGGWLASEILIRSSHRFSSAVLVGTLGAKFSDRLTRDITDIHGLETADVEELLFRDQNFRERDLTSLDEAELTGIARSREAFTYFGWKPYMHNAGLARWLHRIDIPTLLLWGHHDGFVTTKYGRQFAKAIPGAKLDSIPNAGHYPHVERPDETATRILAFANS